MAARTGIPSRQSSNLRLDAFSSEPYTAADCAVLRFHSPSPPVSQGEANMDWNVRCKQIGQALPLILLTLANSGCLTAIGDMTGATYPILTSPVPTAPDSAPESSPAPKETAAQDNELVIWRAVSSDPEAAGLPLTGNATVPGELEICPLNSAIQLATGNADPQTREEALKSLGLFGITGMAQMMRRIGSPGGSGGLHHLGDITDDVLQPDDESQLAKRVRAPFAFGLEWKY
jgi:hypothetical protein